MSLYDDLGISKNATNDEIKSAFKKLALKHHPDRGGNEEEFKRIQKAYETLSDDQKRRQYDLGGQQQQFFGGAGGFQDVFEQMFGGRHSNPFGTSFNFHSHPGPQTGQGFPETAPVISLSLDLTLEDMYFNKTRELSYTCREKCKCCQKCTMCQGRGIQVQFIRMGPIIQQMQTECPGCKSLGVSGSCDQCGSKGWKQLNKVIQLNITRNVVNMGRMTIKGIGHEDLHAQNTKGDINIVFKISTHPIFIKEGNDLKLPISISFRDSICGTNITVPHFGGDFNIDTTQFGVIKPESEHSVPGKGFTPEGNLIICFKVNGYPKLSPEQIEKIKEIL